MGKAALKHRSTRNGNSVRRDHEAATPSTANNQRDWTSVAICFGVLVAVFGITQRVLLPQPKRSTLVSAYVPEYRAGYVDENINNVSKWVDQLILFSVQPHSDGSIKFEPGLGKDGLKYAKRFKAAGVKSVTLSIGGGGRSDGFRKISLKKNKREKFAINVLELCDKFGFDGIDLNWEGMQGGDAENFAHLIVELRRVLGETKTMSASIHVWERLNAKAWASLDHVQVMTYDLVQGAGAHDSFDKVVSATTAFIKANRCPPQKVVLGLAAYVRDGASVVTYNELYETNENNKQQARLDSLLFAVDSKIDWAKENELGGVFLWEAGQDALRDGDVALLARMRHNVQPS
eukprot:m.184577 g.184577  ORF g.184577 m.184577 type:complete len:347 (-) comp32197_c1_seq2:2241-3281(-)